jgi:carbonic anhydrase/acetyltransferase-like protein (isoleucine patch superfamily)
MGNHCLVGPHSHIVGCIISNCVFLATGTSVFHGASIGSNSEVQVNGIVHLKTRLAPHTVVPIGWVTVGDPAVILPPQEHTEIWRVQKPLDFPGFVYAVARNPEEETMPMEEITRRRSKALSRHREDEFLK